MQVPETKDLIGSRSEPAVDRWAKVSKQRLAATNAVAFTDAAHSRIVGHPEVEIRAAHCVSNFRVARQPPTIVTWHFYDLPTIRPSGFKTVRRQGGFFRAA